MGNRLAQVLGDAEQRELLEQYAKMEDLDVDASGPSLWNRIKDAVTGRG